MLVVSIPAVVEGCGASPALADARAGDERFDGQLEEDVLRDLAGQRAERVGLAAAFGGAFFAREIGGAQLASGCLTRGAVDIALEIGRVGLDGEARGRVGTGG